MLIVAALGLRMVTAVAGTPAAAGQNRPDTPPWRLLQAPEAEQIATVRETLDRGLPPDNIIGLLIINKPSLVLPILEQKIEQVLKSPSPLDCFKDKTTDPSRFITLSAWAIANTGSEEALRQIAKLIRLDEGQFGRLVKVTLDSSETYSKSHNPFVVAYGGLAIEDPAVNQRIATWVEESLSVDPGERARAETAARAYGPTPPAPAEKMKRFWAEAMLDHYGGIPNESQWARDPIASRLRAPLAASLRQEMPPLAREALQKRIPK